MMSLVFPVIKAEWHLLNWQLAMEGSATVMGMCVGAVVLGRLRCAAVCIFVRAFDVCLSCRCCPERLILHSDKIGRRPVFQLSLFVSSIFGFLSALAPEIYSFATCRALLGFGYGGNVRPYPSRSCSSAVFTCTLCRL